MLTYAAVCCRRMLQASSILAEAFELACRHRVKIESNFANVCVAIMVLEGVGRQLDPSLDILQAAAPIVLRNLALTFKTPLSHGYEASNPLSKEAPQCI